MRPGSWSIARNRLQDEFVGHGESPLIRTVRGFGYTMPKADDG